MKNHILFLALFIILLPFGARSQSGKPAAASKDSAVVIKPEVIPIVDVNFRIEKTRKTLSEKSNELNYSPLVLAIDSMLDERQEFLRNEARDFREYNPYNLSKFFLENTYRAWTGYHIQLDTWKTSVNNQLEKTSNNIKELDFIKSEWELTLESVKKANESEEIQSRIEKVVYQVDSLIGAFRTKAESLISIEARITDAMSFSDNIISDVDQLQQHLRDSLLIAREVPLWQINLEGEDFSYFKGRIHRFWSENSKIFRNYFNSVNYTIYLIVLAIIVFLLYHLRRKYFKIGLKQEDLGFINAKRIILRNFYPMVISIAIFLYITIFPNNPLAISAFLILLLLICMQFILADFIGVKGRRIIWILSILLVINQMETILWYFYDWARIFLLIESSLLMLASLYVIHPGKRKVLIKESPFMRNTVRMGFIVFILGAVAFAANVLGYTDLSVLMLKVAIQTSVVLVIIHGLIKIFRVIAISLVSIIRSTNLASLNRYLDKLQSRLLSIINILMVLYLFALILNILEIRRPLLDWLARNLEQKWIIGTMSVSIGGILLLIIILLATFVVARFFKVLIEDEIASRVRLPKGVPFAISVTIRYFIVILGFVFALSAAGIDLGEFGLIAGALGIGIGFGLQNIVANFISGLILIYERPVQTGDTVEVENLMGEVKKIGIRSSNVRTYDGAEVVVPNSNLVSNQLINWTLSDRRKRIEIKVGVAYGSDPNVVLDLLEKVAASHENVLAEPEPLALFEEFGDSSLNFRLLFWVYFDKGFTTRSDVSVGIYNILAENNITIPFPQMDVYVKRDS